MSYRVEVSGTDGDGHRSGAYRRHDKLATAVHRAVIGSGTDTIHSLVVGLVALELVESDLDNSERTLYENFLEAAIIPMNVRELVEEYFRK